MTGRGTILTGKVATGSLAIGDKVCVPLNSGETVGRKVGGIVMFRKVLGGLMLGGLIGLVVSILLTRVLAVNRIVGVLRFPVSRSLPDEC